MYITSYALWKKWKLNTTCGFLLNSHNNMANLFQLSDIPLITKVLNGKIHSRIKNYITNNSLIRFSGAKKKLNFYNFEDL